jgi:hypothetical protein
MNIPPVAWITLLAMIAVTVLLLLAAARRRAQRRKEGDLQQRIAQMKDVTVNRKFHQPDDADLDPNIEYINAVRSVTDSSFNLILFGVNGISERKQNLSEDEVWKFAALGHWEHTADNYRTTPEGMRMIIQFERMRRPK